MLLRLICPTSVFITPDPTNPHTPSVTNITPIQIANIQKFNHPNCIMHGVVKTEAEQ